MEHHRKGKGHDIASFVKCFQRLGTHTRLHEIRNTIVSTMVAQPVGRYSSYRATIVSVFFVQAHLPLFVLL